MSSGTDLVLIRGIAAMGILSGLIGCAGTTGTGLGLTDAGRLKACPSSPNCVCSDEAEGGHYVAPLVIAGDGQAAWDALIAHIEGDPSYTVKVKEADYLRAEARTRLLRFVDDVEFHWRATEGKIAMRSASRLGYSDLGANRRRVESVRAALEEAGVVEAGEQ